MLYAKLTKKNNFRVVCGACGNGLAYMALEPIGRYDVGLSRTKPEPIVPMASRDLYRFLLIGEGWFPDSNGVWRPSHRARRQIRRGFSPQNRRLPSEMARIDAKDEGVGQNRITALPRSGFLLTALPAEIVCIYCEMRQVLDAETLKADAFAPPKEWEEAQLAELQRSGSQPRKGFYPGSFPVLYYRVPEEKKPWLTYPDMPLYLAEFGVRRKWYVRDGRWVDDPVDDYRSAVAESE